MSTNQPAPPSNDIRRGVSSAMPAIQAESSVEPTAIVGWRRRSQVRVRALVLLASLFLVVSWLWTDIPTHSGAVATGLAWCAFMGRTFVFHIGLALAILALIAAVIRDRRCATVAMLTAALAVSSEATFSSRTASAVDTGTATISLLSMNVFEGNDRYGDVLDAIQRADADILLIQEYTDKWDAAIGRKLIALYPHTWSQPLNHAFGMAIFAREPFDLHAVEELTLGNLRLPQIRVEIEVGKTRMALYQIHTMPPRPLAGARQHARQTTDLLKLLRAERLPTIVAGDFNLTQHSKFAAELREMGFVDAFDCGGNGRGATWPARGPLRHLPGIRIDHIFIGGGIDCTFAETLDASGSDHLPVRADLTIPATSSTKTVTK